MLSFACINTYKIDVISNLFNPLECGMIINARNIKQVLKEMKPTETFFRYYHKEGTVKYNTNYELVDEVRMWRRQCKQEIIKIREVNNLTKTIEGKPYYILVIESTESNWRFDPIGLGFDEECIINGIIYVFKREKDRDAAYKYIKN